MKALQNFKDAFRDMPKAIVITSWCYIVLFLSNFIYWLIFTIKNGWIMGGAEMVLCFISGTLLGIVHFKTVVNKSFGKSDGWDGVLFFAGIMSAVASTVMTISSWF